MEKVRGFEVAKGFEEKEINLPVRATKNAAGYDFECAEDITIQPIWNNVLKLFMRVIKTNRTISDMLQLEEWQKGLKPTLVKTGVKAYMQGYEALFLYNRSSNPLKKFLFLGNGVGVVDADYYENPDNDGHIMFQFINFGLFPVTIKKGERIGQGVFADFYVADNDKAENVRQSGFGSTGK